MSLVDDDRVVPFEHPVAVELVEQDAVGHELDAGVLADLVGEPDLVADEAAELGAELLGDAFGYRACGDASWLSVPDRLPPELKADLGQLRRLARAGRAGDDDDLVVPDDRRDVVLLLADRQVGRVGDRGNHEPSSLLRFARGQLLLFRRPGKSNN